MSSNLVIVESPAKAKTIQNILGKDFVVMSSYGHVRDLSKKDLGIEIENNYTPHYIVPDDKIKIIHELRQLAKKADIVWLASDEDREGEAIAWHLQDELKLPQDKIKRIVFHEITKNAILNAIKHPRGIDHNLVNAQQARRVLDRLVGFELSPLLWKKIKPSLSAGRVQSVAVRLIVEREREILSSKISNFYKVIGQFSNHLKQPFKAELSVKFPTQELATQFLEKCLSASFIVKSVEKKPSKRTPAAPFTTSTLQQEAGRRLGFSVSQTMRLAQSLYESGHITYMRTDSVNLSEESLQDLQRNIVSQFGEQYLQIRRYTTKAKGAQEAHEAIRPTYMNKDAAGTTTQEKKLYDLIWKRTMASQMSEAKLERTVVNINVSNAEQHFNAEGEVLLFDGFLRLWNDFESLEEDNSQEGNKRLPILNEKEELQYIQISATERFTTRPARYSEAALVKSLEELGIGRPSTYAPTISTIIQRGYVEKGDREGEERKYEQILLAKDKITTKALTEITGKEKAKLFPSDIALIVNDYLVEHFKNVLDFDFTANVEAEFDHIAEGNTDWRKMIDKFYLPFHKNIEKSLSEERPKTAEKILGKDSKSGHTVITRIGRYGPLVQIGTSEETEKPKFANLRKNQSINTITLEEALKLFDLPRVVGEYEGKEVKVAVGRFGPYIQHDGKFISLEKNVDDPLTVELDRTIDLIEQKRKKDSEKTIFNFEEIQVLNGRYGAYIHSHGINYKIPKGIEPQSLTKEQCIEIISKTNEKEPIKKKNSKSTLKNKK